MVEAANVLGLLGAVLLLMAVIAWTKLIRRPLTQRADGSTPINSDQRELGSELLFWAAGLSSTAALVAIAGWVFI
jgi:hypothetical protein